MTLLCILFLTMAAFAQQVGPRSFKDQQQQQAFVKQPPSATVQPQPAVTVLLTLTIEQATILEKARVDSQDCKAEASGQLACTMVYVDLKDLAQSNLNAFVLQLSKRYPPAAASTAEVEAAAATKRAEDQRKQALPPPK